MAQLNLTKINKSQDEIIEKNFNSFNIFQNKDHSNNFNNNISNNINKVESVSTEQTSKKEMIKINIEMFI